MSSGLPGSLWRLATLFLGPLVTHHHPDIPLKWPHVPHVPRTPASPRPNLSLHGIRWQLLPASRSFVGQPLGNAGRL